MPAKLNRGPYDPRKIVLAEIQSLILALRTSSKFSTKDRFQFEVTPEDETPIMRQLQTLKQNLSFPYRQVNTAEVLAPFFTVITNGETTGPITGVALSALHKFLVFELIRPHEESSKALVKEMVNSVCRCQFEVTDSSTDEAVMNKLLQVLVSLVCTSVAPLLDSGDLLEISQACFRVGKDTRPTDLLRRESENALQRIVHEVFARCVSTGFTDPEVSADDLFMFVCSLCNPTDQGKSASVRLLGLQLALSVLESVGSRLAEFPSLLRVSRDQLSRALLSNLGTTNPVVLCSTLRTIHTLVLCAAPHLHEQLEAFLFHVLQRTSAASTKGLHAMTYSQASTVYENEELVLEEVVEMCREPGFPVYLFAHYDLDTHAMSLFEHLCTLLSKNASPASKEPLNVLHTLSLEALLGILRSVADRSLSAPPIDTHTQMQRGQIEERLRRKQENREAVDTFNQNPSPKKSIETLQEIGVLSKPADAMEIALFLRNNALWLDKHKLGEYLGEPDDLCMQVLREYTRLCNFHNQTIEEGLRHMLSTFQLPGEAQKIGRILESFAEEFYHSNANTYLESVDGAYVFAYSIIMLHTDLHNSQVKRKMTLPDFIRNNRGINGGEDIPQSEQERIFWSISRKPMHLCHCITDAHRNDPLWEDLLRRSESYLRTNPHEYPPLAEKHDNNNNDSNESSVSLVEEEGVLASPVPTCCTFKFDYHMFLCMWPRALSAMQAVLERTDDMHVVDTVLRGLEDCAQIAFRYKIGSVLDNLVIALCKFTSALEPSNDDAIPWLCRSIKAQKAIQRVFNITQLYGNQLRSGWKNVLDLILRLFELDLLPPEVGETESFDSNQPRRRRLPVGSRRGHGSNSSKGSAISLLRFWQPVQETVPEVDESVIEAAKEVVQQCHVQRLLMDAKQLEPESLHYLIKALVHDSHSVCETGLPAQDRDVETVMFCLSLLVDITVANRERLTVVWSPVFHHINNLLRLAINGGHPIGEDYTAAQLSPQNCPSSSSSSPTVMVSATRETPTLLDVGNPASSSEDCLSERSSSGSPSKGYVYVEDEREERESAELDVLVEGVIGAVMRLCIQLMGRESGAVKQDLCQALKLVSELPRSHIQKSAPLLTAGVSALLRTSSGSIKGAEVWDTLFRVLKQGAINDRARLTALEAMSLVVKEGKFAWPENVPMCVETLLCMAQLGTRLASPAQTIQVTDMLQLLHQHMISYNPSMAYPSQHWVQGWLSVLRGIGYLCASRNAEVRNRAIGTLQKALFDMKLVEMNPKVLETCFTGMFFPFLQEMLRRSQQDYSKGQLHQFEETRMRAWSLFTKVFLQFLHQLRDTDTFPKLWADTLSILLRYTAASNPDDDSVLEPAKNMLLVMSAQGVFSESSPRIWQHTKQRLGKIFSDTLAAIDPEHDAVQEEVAAPRDIGTESGSNTTGNSDPSPSSHGRSSPVPIPKPGSPAKVGGSPSRSFDSDVPNPADMI